MDTQRGTVVFVTGAFVSHHCWDDWREYFATRGYASHAPPHPNKEGEPAFLRAQHPKSPIAKNTFSDLVQNYAGFIAGLSEKPILVGHSLGGLVTQILLQRDLATAAVVMDSVPPQGVFSFEWSFLKAVTPPLGLLGSVDETYLMSFEQWQYAFTNGMPYEAQRAAYDRLVVPESKRAARGPLTSEGKVDFARQHAPLLFLAGSEDHLMPASLNLRNYRRYSRRGDSMVNFKVLTGRNHFLLGQPSWQQTADEVLGWLGALNLERDLRTRPRGAPQAPEAPPPA